MSVHRLGEAGAEVRSEPDAIEHVAKILPGGNFAPGWGEALVTSLKQFCQQAGADQAACAEYGEPHGFRSCVQ